jgi:hypothetical protein
MLLTIAFLCFAVQVVAWVVLPSSARTVAEEETELAAEAAAA